MKISNKAHSTKSMSGNIATLLVSLHNPQTYPILRTNEAFYSLCLEWSFSLVPYWSLTSECLLLEKTSSPPIYSNRSHPFLYPVTWPSLFHSQWLSQWNSFMFTCFSSLSSHSSSIDLVRPGTCLSHSTTLSPTSRGGQGSKQSLQ